MSDKVAPLAGAWVETAYLALYIFAHYVAPLAGAWVETAIGWRRGDMHAVAPLAGAWVETPMVATSATALWGRAPRGRVG